MLEIKDLVVSYDGVPALFGVSLSIKKGEVVSVVGSNGAGKSTLLKAISGLLKSDQGEMILDGKPFNNKQTHDIVKSGIVLVPEGRHLFGRMNILQNLMLGAYHISNKQEIAERIENVYSIFPRLKEREKQLAGTLSGGEQQMVAIARGLMANPRILMLDEPSLGLAPIMVKEMFRMINDIKEKGVTILLVEQRLQDALMCSDRGYVLQTGKVVLEGDAQKLLNAPEVRQAYLGL